MNRSEHMRFNMLLFGETFEDIIMWQDLFVRTEGLSHRKFRHDPDGTPLDAVRHFITETNTYPESKRQAIMNVIKSHIACDLISSSAEHHFPSTIHGTIHGKQVVNNSLFHSVIMYVCKSCGHKTLTITMIRKHYQKHHPTIRILF